MTKTRALKWLVAFALIALLGSALIFDWGSRFDLAWLQAQQVQWQSFLKEHPWQAAGLYFSVYVLVTAASLPGAVWLTLLGGALFGVLWGTVLVSFASTFGATLAFLLSRFLLRDWVRQRFGSRLQSVEQGLARDGALYLFTLRLVPVVPFFVVNLLFGLTAMRPLRFLWVSQLGMLAGTVVYVNAGTQLAQLESIAGILSPVLIGSFVLLGFFPWIARAISQGLQARRVYANYPKPKQFDRNLIVIGGGSAGLVTAYIAAAAKASVTLVEQHKLGGDCLNTGCVPSKALIRSARVLNLIRRAQDFGLRAAPAQAEFAAVMERVQGVIRGIEPHDSIERYTGLGVDVRMGRARIASPWEVEITGADGSQQRLTTRAIVIAAGARPLVPAIPGLDQVRFYTSDTVWSLREQPRRLLVLGGGPIGCELAQAFARLGSEVTQVEQGERLLAREDPEVSEAIERRFAAEGIRVLTKHRALHFEWHDGEQCLVAGATDSAADPIEPRFTPSAVNATGQPTALGTAPPLEVRIAFDAVLLALGRSANLAGYGLEELGIETGRTVHVNETLQTRFPNIYAAGDVAGPYQFTHVAAHQAWYAAINALFAPFKRFKVDYSVIPWATFTDPEVARVGLNEQEARERNIPFEVTTYGIDDLDRAIADGSAHGFVKVLTVPGKDRILGATIVGEHAGDLVAEFVLAMKHGLGLNKILGTIHIYPTLAEANKYVAGAWRRAHAPQGLLHWVERFHGWRR